MKYMCRGSLNGSTDEDCDINKCLHSKPHDWSRVEDKGAMTNCFSKDEYETDCDCLPVPLEYLMREIIEEEEYEQTNSRTNRLGF